MAQLRAGARIWIPCQVKPGPFSNERIVRVEHADGVWVGFVSTSELKEPVPNEGNSFIQGLVVEVKREIFLAKLPGHSLSASNIFRGDTQKAGRVAISA